MTPTPALPTPTQRAALLATCWTAHDAHWFAVVAASLGIDAANRLSRAAAQAQGRFEAREVIRLFGLRAVATLDDWLGVQEVFFGLLAPGVLHHDVERVDERTCRIRIDRCRVYERAADAGVADHYACGVAARLAGWLQGLDLGYALGPCNEGCPLARGKPCVYTLMLRFQEAATAPPAA